MPSNAELNPFYQQFNREILKLGGMFNAHLHLDRVGTLHEKYMQNIKHVILENSHISLHEKHHLIHALHNGPAFTHQDLKDRINICLDIMLACNTARADTLVDVTADKVGLTALHTLQEIQTARASEIELRIAAYSPFGFKDSEPQSWQVFAEGAQQSDFIAALPEADDIDEYPGHIGFEAHCRRTISLALQLNKPLHVHTDQCNEPSEAGTERLINVIKELGGPFEYNNEPLIWAVHMISPSTYNDERFYRLVNDLVDLNIGVICCPSAAIGMRQLRPILTPTYNSIPRILELLVAGVHVRLASDNIADICSPSTTANLTDEVFVLSAALRFYHVGILAKLAAGKKLNDEDRSFVKDHLEKNCHEIEKVVNETTLGII
ncbi:MAG TPA: hypothetical protein ENK06_02065 [Gammaproteobacteria bacterium]|nr:hypothetical protein [Gammaproteobacteria bacterium]